jgi:hypothetical protein
MPGKTNEGKRKILKEIITIPLADAVALTKTIMAEEDAEVAK